MDVGDVDLPKRRIMALPSLADTRIAALDDMNRYAAGRGSRRLRGGAEGIRTSDLRSVGAHALDGAAAGVDSSLRPECAKNGRSPTSSGNEENRPEGEFAVPNIKTFALIRIPQ
jgi:hypothetical protein